MNAYKKFYSEIKDNFDLIRYLTVFDLKTNISRTYLGFIWWILDPLLYMAIFYLLVHVILGRGGPDYPIILFTALIPLKWTTSCLVEGTSAISGKGRIIKQIYVPKIVFIIVRLLVNTVKFSISAIVLLLFLFFYGVDLGITVLYFPLIILLHALVILPFMVLFAHLGIYVKDIKNMMQYIARMLMYLSPVLFTLDSVPSNLVNLFYLNPLTTFIESYRSILIHGDQPLWLLIGAMIVFSVILLNISLHLLFKYENQYAKVI
ncbi:lipopolysaccharide transport system permease protein/teichoic acid transport system permease protein [Bacillus pakistanensis]|uniref:Transport permease protein n=1 Tax=Rossellomorea pakistanensis TaxID=992288 RepID=A0ABS2ND25_9BACI|nr:ABC transporter permease [Bacillus pakistanensis]MBM7585762.1 lipopolysaccharide transport system permease protein/teichoic acid transport system permease protein [Bacillus pakistanensis]